MSRTWVVVALYNEATVIERVVKDLRRDFPCVVCVDDGSTDDSGDVARLAGATVIRHAINLGQGAALQTGIKYALGDPEMTEVVTFDADGQHRTQDAEDMVRQLRDHDLDVVFGSRFLGQKSHMTWPKWLVLRAAARWTQLATGMHVTDAHNGLRVFSRRTCARLHITQNRMAHASEIVTQIGRMNVHWEEHTTRVLYTPYSRSKGQSLLNSVNILVDLFLR
jgi:glycosyltransferase involved in cell wall biosynthesis